MTQIQKLVITLCAIAPLAVAADNTLGIWKYNAAKSHSAAGHRPYNSLTITRESTDDGVRQTVQEENASGEKFRAVFIVKHDGSSAHVNGTLNWDTVAEKQIDANTVSEEIAKQVSVFDKQLRNEKVDRRAEPPSRKEQMKGV